MSLLQLENGSKPLNDKSFIKINDYLSTKEIDSSADNLNSINHIEQPSLSSSDNRSWFQKPQIWSRLLFVLLLISSALLVVIFPIPSFKILLQYLSWMNKNSIFGSCIFVLVIIVGVLFMLPETLFTVGSGFIFTQMLGVVEY